MSIELYGKLLIMVTASNGLRRYSNGFWQDMRDLRMPVSYRESQVMNYKANNYGIVNSAVIDPVISNIMLVSNSNIMSDKTGKSIMNIGASDLAFIPKTLEEYEAKYNSLLDSLSLCFLCGPLYR